MVSEFERQRQANIERNKKLLSSLNLNTISNGIKESIKKENSKPSTPRVKRQKVEVQQPTRRSRRLAGVALDNSHEQLREFEFEQDKQRRDREELEKLKTLRVNGELSLLDLVKDKVKTEDGEDDSNLLEKFQTFLGNSKSFSIGDYYDTIVKKDNSSRDVAKVREDLGSKQLYKHFKPNEIKLTKDRMTYICFHPNVDKKLVFGGDSTGNFGIWDSENTDEVDIMSFKLHGKNIAKLEFSLTDVTKIYSASYDGSIRSIDLATMKSSQVFINEHDIGITDIQHNNEHEIYYTTMQGEFGKIDLRSSDHSGRQVVRLANKKIGGFSINPSNINQIATASLDRTMKVWDIRRTTVCDWNEWDDALDTLHNYGSYDSRLSVSIVDWSKSGDLVCNGYDDTVNIFNLSELTQKDVTYSAGKLTPQHKIKHNCQTGRWVSILKARWQKLTPDLDKFVIANMNKYFDVYDRDGNQLAHLSDPYMTNVPAVCNFHPTQNWLVGGGASGKVYMFS